MENRLTNLGYIKDLARRYNFTFDKKYGQNFIVNPSVCPKIAEFGEVDSDTGVIEIGAGIGVLTEQLAKRAKKVVCIEIDTTLKDLLCETLSDYDNIEIIYDDVMNVDLSALIAEKFSGMRVVVCANLPYYITSPVIMKLLEERLPIDSITVMVQKERAQRICAPQGSRDSGAISLAVNYYSQPKVCFNVSRGSFYPSPKVDSCVIKLSIRKEPPVSPASEKNMFSLIRASFTQRRKTFVNSASATLSLTKQDIENALESMGLDTMIRPEKLTLSQFATLSDILLKEENI